MSPGEALRNRMAGAGLSARRLALHLMVPPNRISGILHGKRGVTVDTAFRLARYFSTTPRYWLELQLHQDLRKAKKTSSYLEVEVMQWRPRGWRPKA